MKLKAIFALVLAGAALGVSAQSQGYLDGIEYYKAGQYENAQTILQNTLNAPTTDKALANYYLGQTELALKNTAAAKKYFDAGIAADPTNGYNYVGLGALDLLNKDAKGAEENFKKAQSFAKKNNEVIVAIARAYYNADPVAYAKEIEKYLAKAHKDSKHAEASIYILEGDMLYDQEQWGQAAGKYEMATGYDKGNPEGYVKYANSYFRVNPEFSINKLREFLSLAPNSALAQRELAEKLYEANYWKQASDQYGKYIQNPNHFPQDKARYSVLLYYGENYPQSLQVAQEVLAQKPDNFLMQRLQFLNEAQLGQVDKAIQDGEAFFAKNPDGYFTVNDYTTLADAYSQAGNDSIAVLKLEAAVVKYPENGDLLNTLSTYYTKNKNYLKAAEAYEAYLATVEEPSLNDFFTASGRWLNAAATAPADADDVRTKAAEKGLAFVNKALEGAPNNPNLYQRKARLQMAANHNQPTEAVVADYAKMVSLLDADPANADPANPQNDLNMYKEAYMFSSKFYQDNGDKENLAKYNELLKGVLAKQGTPAN